MRSIRQNFWLDVEQINYTFGGGAKKIELVTLQLRWGEFMSLLSQCSVLGMDSMHFIGTSSNHRLRKIMS